MVQTECYFVYRNEQNIFDERVKESKFLSSWNKCEKWNIQHVTIVGRRKNLSPRQDSNLWPPKHPADALITWATETSWRARPYTAFIFTVLAPSAKTTNNDHVVSCEYTKPLVIPHKIQWSRKKKQSPAWYGNNRPKLQLSLYNHLEVHSRRYMILRNRRAYSFSNIITGAPGDRHCRCLTKIASIRRSVFGQIENRKPPEHSCLLNKL